MTSLVTSLSRSPLLRRVVRDLRLNRLGNAWLGRFPRQKRMSGSGILYRASRLESIPLAHEMLEADNLYDASLLPEGFTTFADLGCNVGYFTCWLAHHAGGRKLRGLMLDANAEAVREAQWHAQANGWREVYALHGLAGEGTEGKPAEFYLYESNICSTTQRPDTANPDLKGTWANVRVPCVSISEHWHKHFGDARCQVLKVDIEGSESGFFRTEPSFLDLVDAAFVEWHKWSVSLDELQKMLAPHGLDLIKTLEENDQMGTAFFARR